MQEAPIVGKSVPRFLTGILFKGKNDPSALLVQEWGKCAYVIIHTILPPRPVFLWIELGGKPK